MAKKQRPEERPRLSKRQKRQRIIIYFMVFLMLVSILTAGLGGIALL